MHDKEKSGCVHFYTRYSNSDIENVESFPEGETCYDASEGCFRICASKPGCDNIKFSISNTVTKDEVEYTNGVITDCFVRIVPATP